MVVSITLVDRRFDRGTRVLWKYESIAVSNRNEGLSIDRLLRLIAVRPALMAALSVLGASRLAAQICRPDSSLESRSVARPANYIFFRRDHQRVAEPSFLDNENLVGAQLTFTWRQLEPERDRYHFDELRIQLAFLRQHGKRLVVQLQDDSFSDSIFVPEYLVRDTAFHGGAAREYDPDDKSRATFGGWAARRWDPAVRARFAKLLDALGREFDGRLEGIVLPETAIGMGVDSLRPKDFTFDGYAKGIQEITTAMRRAFPHSCVIVYGNFMPGEWLPGDDKGYLRAVYAHAESVGAGVGGPDLLPHARAQRNHSYPLIAARRPGIVAGIAVQDGNLTARNPQSGSQVTVQELYRFAKDELRLDFIFWGTEEPYYSRDVLPFLRALPRNRSVRSTRAPSQPGN